MALSKLKKGLLIALGIVVLLIVLVIAFISPITKYLIEKYDEKYTGRQIEMDWAYVNPFTGSVHFDDLKMYEYQSDSIFVSFSGLGVDFSPLKALSKNYQITGVTLDKPYIKVIQDKKKFNFDDLIEKFTKKDTTVVEDTKDTVHFSVEDIEIKGGLFHYIDKAIPVNYKIREFNFESEGFFWDRDTIPGKFSFKPGDAEGHVKGDFTLNLKSNDYRLASVIEKFDLGIVEQYVKDFANYGKFTANLDADIKIKGNFNNSRDLDAKGYVAVNDFHFGKKPGDDYTSFKKFAVNIIDLRPEKKVYHFDSVMVLHPYFRYEQYDTLDNIQNMFGKGGSNVEQAKATQKEKFNLVLEIADYVKLLSKNFFESYYKINKVAIYNADIQYKDFSLNETFFLGMNPLTIIADSIDKNNQRFNVIVKSGIKPHGNIDIILSMNPKTEGNFDMKYKFAGIPASTFNPYLVSFTSYPFDRGTMEIYGNWNVRNNKIDSDNHFVFLDPRLTKRVKKNGSNWLPVPLVMAFIRERGNFIDYSVPIKGNLKDPSFKIWDVVLDVLKNIVEKPATTGYRFELKNVQQEVEKALYLNWATRASKLLTDQDKFVSKIAEFLKETPEASITVDPITYEDKEKEYIMFFEAKKKYYQAKNKLTTISEDDSTKIEKLDIKDKGFVDYLNKFIKDTLTFTIQKKCYDMVGDRIIEQKYKLLKETRKSVFMKYFHETETATRVKWGKDIETLPTTGFSHLRINYKGEIPDYLKESNEQLQDLNAGEPREKYFKGRKKVLGIF